MNSLCGCNLTISQGCVVFKMKSYIHKNWVCILLGPRASDKQSEWWSKGSVNLPLCILWLSWAFTPPFLCWCHGRTWRTSETMVAVRLVHVSVPRLAALVLQRWSLALLVGGRADWWPGLTCASKASVCERIRHRCKTGAFPVADKNLQYCGEPPCEV